MKKVILTKGLPASGKTTWAIEMINNHPNRYKNICKDDLRKMLDNSQHSKARESFILRVRNSLILQALDEGYHVIISDTNLHEKHEQEIRELVRGKAEVEIKFFDVPLEECIRRDKLRENPVGEKVITEMYNQFLKSEQPIEQYIPDESKPKAIIVDIDGTLAKMNNRSPYDYSKVDTDILNKPIYDLVDLYRMTGREVLIVSGRDGSCRKITEKWLTDNYVFYTEFFMREVGNREKDDIIKNRIFNEHIRNNYNVEIVIDDRDRCIRMWRNLGLTCLQVDYGNF